MFQCYDNKIERIHKLRVIDINKVLLFVIGNKLINRMFNNIKYRIQFSHDKKKTNEIKLH